MFTSLSSRIAAVGVLVIVALSILVVAMVDAARQSRESFRWVTHSTNVIQRMEDTVSGLREAESGQRGFILTHNPGMAQSFDRQVEQARTAYEDLVVLTKDNPLQQERIREIGELMEERIELMRTPLELARQEQFDEARSALIEGRGMDTMSQLSQITGEFMSEERTLQSQRIQAAERRLEWGRRVALYGGPLIGLMVLVMGSVLVRGIRNPVRVLTHAMTNLGQGGFDQHIPNRMGSREFNLLADGYNSMTTRLGEMAAAQKVSESELKSMHTELLTGAEVLRSRGEVIELLGAMSHRMQATRNDEELAEVISIYVPRVLPDLAGALYAHNNSRNLLVQMSSWGEATHAVPGFAPEDCWALRRGQSHYVSEPGKDIICHHVADHDCVYHCEPLLASGEVIGVLYLDGLLDEEARFRLGVLSENIASAMVNRRLQRDLKEQTIRDPLTGLFNRRYMEEALALEVARAARSGTPLCVVMCDVDHFKRFNDEFGHDAGDAVLQTVGAVLVERFRDGDIVCRYGGEEFTIIAPGTSQEDLMRRVEAVRLAIAKATPHLRGKSLGSITMSFGVSQWHADMAKDGSSLVATADSALYQAKRDGRNRIVGHIMQDA